MFSVFPMGSIYDFVFQGNESFKHHLRANSHNPTINNALIKTFVKHIKTTTLQSSHYICLSCCMQVKKAIKVYRLLQVFFPSLKDCKEIRSTKICFLRFTPGKNNSMNFPCSNKQVRAWSYWAVYIKVCSLA